MNPIVTKEDFVKTYKDGLEKVEKYERAMDLLAEDVTLESIIRKIGISRKTLYKWRKEKTKLTLSRAGNWLGEKAGFRCLTPRKNFHR